MIPRTPGQPSRIIKRTVDPTAKTGKQKALRKVASLAYITPKSLAKRFVIFPNCSDLMMYEVRFDILL